MTQRFVLPNKLLLFGGQFPKKITCNFRKKEKRKTKPIMRGVRALRADGLNTSSTPFSFLSFLFYLPSSRYVCILEWPIFSGQVSTGQTVPLIFHDWAKTRWYSKQIVYVSPSILLFSADYFTAVFVVLSVKSTAHSYDRQNWFLPTSPPG